MKYFTSIGALLLAGSLAACGNNTDAPDSPAGDDPAETVNEVSSESPDAAGWEESVAGLRGLAEEAFSLDNGLEADLAPINAALPDLVSISWDEKSFDAASGATVFSGLSITIATEPEFGLRAEEAEVWGLNSELIAARLNGERLEEQGLAFNRFEARNVSYFGLAGAFNTVFDALESEFSEETGEDIDFGVDTFDSTVGEMVMSNVSLRPFELSKVPDSFFSDLGLTDPGEELSEDDAAQKEMALTAVRLAQQVLAVGRSLSIEDAAAYDTRVRFLMNQPGMTQTLDISWDFYGYEDLNGLDIGRAVIVDSVQSQSMEMTDETGELAEIGMDEMAFDQVEEAAFMSYEDLKLDKLAGFLARGEFPSMDERDLLSLGTWEARDYSLKLNDGDVFEAGRVAVDADSFAWFFPEELGLEMDGAELGVAEVGELVLSFIPAEAVAPEEPAAVVEAPTEEAPGAEEDSGNGNGEPAGDNETETAEEDEPSGEEAMANLRTAVDKLDEHGLGTIPFDVSARWSWNGDSGATGLSLDSSSEGFGEGAMSVDVTLPGYDAVQAAFNAEDKETAFREAFMQSFAFNGLRLYETDEGGYDKLFGYVSDIAKLYPDQGWGAMLSSMDAAQMRGMIASMTRSGKQVAAQEFPPAAEWIESVAVYYETPGGSLEIKSTPPEPVTLGYLGQMGPDTPPEQIVEDLGVSVTHTPE